MTFTNANDINASVTQFQSLQIDDKLGLLALIYREVSGSIPAGSLPTSSDVTDIVGIVEKMSEQEKVDALRDLLPATKNDQDEVILDPNPSKALTELAQGKTGVPTGKYGALNPESKLVVWYQLAQKLGSSIPGNYSPSGEATQLLNSFKQLGNEQKVSFVTQLFQELSATHNEEVLHNEAGE